MSSIDDLIAPKRSLYAKRQPVYPRAVDGTFRRLKWLIMAGIGLFLVTSAVGRAWCGYACPQTVWTDLFQHVERFVDGDRNAQVRLAKAPWSVRKIARRLLKHSIWLTIGLLTGGAWIFYFADAPTLFGELIDLDAPVVAYATIGVLTATTYVFGGFMRGQGHM